MILATYGPECREAENGSDYFGKKSTTVSGKTCQHWTQQSPHKHSFKTDDKFLDKTIEDAGNYCRNPDDWQSAWCYTTDPNKRYEACDIPKCDQSG